ncbi:MAG: hypothetical protein WKF48_05770 [Solirubrobacteraceae bacterium]
MPNEGVDIRVRTTGTRAAARDVDRLSSSTGRLGRSARRGAGDVRLFGRATATATGGLRLMTGAVLGTGGALGIGLFLGIKRTTAAWEEARKVEAQTRAAIKSTGGIANVTARDVDRLSGSLSRKAAIDDELIQSGANLLLTFKKVRNETGAGNDIFNRATGAAVDLSAAGFGAVTATSKQLGKALNDPLKGITALGRAGVTFTAGQKKQIESLVETGNLLGAQRIILGEVESQVKGSAEAQATALGRVKVSYENVQESIGKGLAPAVDALADKFDGLFVRAEPEIDKLGDRLGKLFRRDDIELGDKLSLAGADVQRTVRPFTRELGKELSQLELGDKLADAVDTAAPRILEAFGRAAPKAAGVFVKAFINAGPYGQLFTLGLLGAKLGAFNALGSLAWKRFRGAYGRSSRTSPLPPTRIAPPVGGWGKAGAIAGRTFGIAAGLVAAAEIGNAIAKGGLNESSSKDYGGGTTGKGLSTLSNIGNAPINAAGKVLGLKPKERKARGRVNNVRVPDLFARKSITNGPPRAGAPSRKPASADRPRVRAGVDRRQPVVIHTNAELKLTAEGGRLVARHVNRVNADERARK